jgi:hypothetical protein
MTYDIFAEAAREHGLILDRQHEAPDGNVARQRLEMTAKRPTVHFRFGCAIGSQ